MELICQFSEQQLQKILNEGFVYMCACPAQVASAIQNLRALYRYQSSCMTDPDNDASVHALIAQATQDAHARMEKCLHDVLTQEKWDMETLSMPAGLRKRQLSELE